MAKKEYELVIKTIEGLFSKESYKSVDEGIRIVKEENDQKLGCFKKSARIFNTMINLNKKQMTIYDYPTMFIP